MPVYVVPHRPILDPWYGQDHDRRAHLAFIHPADRCFYCGKSFTCERLIYWNGSDEKGIA